MYGTQITDSTCTNKIQYFFFNNQPNALIIHIYSFIKLNVSGIFCAHHQQFSSEHSALVSFMQVFDDRFQAE